MSGSRDAQQVFDAGVLSLGIPIDGLETDRDMQYARLAFKRATEYDPEMSDAWLGRAAAGDATPEVIYHLYRTSKATLGREQRRLGLPRNVLAGRFQTGLYLDYTLSTLTEAWLAFAAGMIDEADYGEAEKVLDELDVMRRGMPDGDAETTEICSYIRAVLHFKTQRWPDVLTTLASSASFTDVYLSAGAHLMVGSACAQMGLFAEGIRRLDQAIEGPIPAARQAADFCKGLTLREMGKEPDARIIFERLYSEDPGFQANAAALNDEKYRLIITTKEQIDSRTDKWDPNTARTDEPAEDTDEERNNEYLRAAQEELNRQIGLDEVKLQVAKLRSAAELAKIRDVKGLSSAARSLHLIFTGPPGTGKTTIARVVAQTYCGLGRLKTPNVIEAKRSDFVGEHLGSTALKTSALIDRAMDGVLFIDEAYTLIQSGLSGGDAFGREAVDTLLARMENDRDRLVVIIAGYDNEINRFLASNEGLASRFTKRINFDSYSPTELGDIGRLTAQRRDSELSEAAYDELVSACQELYDNTSTEPVSGVAHRAIDIAGNGRFVRNVIEAAEEEREYRLAENHGADLAQLDDAQLMRIEAEDMRAALKSARAMLSRG